MIHCLAEKAIRHVMENGSKLTTFLEQMVLCFLHKQVGIFLSLLPDFGLQMKRKSDDWRLKYPHPLQYACWPSRYYISKIKKTGGSCTPYSGKTPNGMLNSIQHSSIFALIAYPVSNLSLCPSPGDHLFPLRVSFKSPYSKVFRKSIISTGWPFY